MQAVSRVRCLVLVLCATFFLAALPATAQTKACALVLMHGKWHNARDFGLFGKKIEPSCDYKSIEMPWSLRRSYDATYPAALAEIQATVAEFRAQGYQRVILVGHSFGANAALAYMAEKGDADGVIALAPGHSPAFMYARGMGTEAVNESAKLVAAGQGDKALTMDDMNQGRRKTVRMRADVLLSYFDPQGLGEMPLTIARFKKPVPLLWVVGTLDPLYPFGAAFAFDKAPAHPASKYLVVQADHIGTPDVAAPAVLAWVQGLP